MSETERAELLQRAFTTDIYPRIDNQSDERLNNHRYNLVIGFKQKANARTSMSPTMTTTLHEKYSRSHPGPWAFNALRPETPVPPSKKK